MASVSSPFRPESRARARCWALAWAASFGVGSSAWSQSCDGEWLGADFLPGCNGTVYAMTVMPNGDLVVGGGFTSVGGVQASRIARWNGTAWSALDQGVNDLVCGLKVLANGDLAVGGVFTTASGVTVNRIARWDGAHWSAFGTGVNSVVNAVTELLDGTPVIGGTFTLAGSTSVNRVAWWDGQAWQPFGAGANGEVIAFKVLPGGSLIMGGSFTSAGNNTVNRAAQWTGTAWAGLHTGFNWTVLGMETAPSGDLIASGDFTQASGVGASRIARWTGTAWTGIGGNMNAEVRTLVPSPTGDLFVGGFFTRAGGMVVGRTARWTNSTWYPMGSGVNGNVFASVRMPNGDIVFGGSFTKANGLQADRLAVWRPRAGSGSAPRITGTPASLIVNSGSPANFSVTATGSPAPIYQWRKDGIDLPGATAASYAIPAVSHTDVGRYSCLVSNACGAYEVSATLTIPGTIADARQAPVGALFKLINVHVANTIDIINANTVASITVEDDTGAMTVFGTNAMIDGVLGATTGGNVLASITGTTDSYLGLAELINVTGVVPANSNAAVTLTDVVPADLEDQSATAEGLESRIVTLRNHVFTETGVFAGSTEFAGGKLWMPTTAIADRLNATLGGVPTGVPVRLTGVFGQYDLASPLDGGYQLNVTNITRECLADFDLNGYINGDDFDFYAIAFEAGAVTADLDGNGYVNGDDMDAFAAAFDGGC